jgi:hypothetical protein
MRAALILLCLALTGCAWGSKPRPQTLATPSAAELGRVVSAHEGKDRAIIEEAAKIDAIAPEARPHTDAQRAAVAAAPAADVAALRASIDALTKARATDAATITDLRAQLDKANSRTDQIIRLGLAAAGAVCIGLGILSAFLAAKVALLFPGLGPRISLGIGALGTGFLFCSFAYGWAMRHQTLVMSVAACLAVAIAALFYANRHHATTSHD